MNYYRDRYNGDIEGSLINHTLLMIKLELIQRKIYIRCLDWILNMYKNDILIKQIDGGHLILITYEKIFIIIKWIY